MHLLVTEQYIVMDCLSFPSLDFNAINDI